MTAHDCQALDPGCYRCDLNRDEINAWIDTLVVTRKGVVHESDCSYATGPTSTANRWKARLSGDRACSRCLPDGLPERL